MKDGTMNHVHVAMNETSLYGFSLRRAFLKQGQKCGGGLAEERWQQ